MRCVSADQPSAFVAVELGDPAADVRDFLRLLEKRPMLFDRFRCPDRFADVAETGEAADDPRVDTVRRRVALIDPPVLEAQDVEYFGRRIAPNRARLEQHRLEILELRTQRFDEAVDSAALHIVGGHAEHLQVLLVVEDDAPVEIDDHDAVVRGFKRGFEQCNRFFERRTIGQGPPLTSMTSIVSTH